MSRKISIYLVLAALPFTSFSCKKKTGETSPDGAKSLNKSLLIGKVWYNKGATIAHDFRANGAYGSGGTWVWKNNSDTMIVDLDGPGTVDPPEEWKFFWSEEHQMACVGVGWNSGEILFKDQKW